MEKRAEALPRFKNRIFRPVGIPIAAPIDICADIFHKVIDSLGDLGRFGEGGRGIVEIDGGHSYFPPYLSSNPISFPSDLNNKISYFLKLC